MISRHTVTVPPLPMLPVLERRRKVAWGWRACGVVVRLAVCCGLAGACAAVAHWVLP